jgi:hypothetical protein
VRDQPAFGGIAFAILLLGSILLRNELRHQRQNHIMAGATIIAASME